MLKLIHLRINLNFWWKLTASTFKDPSSFWEGWKKFIKLFMANPTIWNKLWASHLSWCLITTMGHSERRRKSFQIGVGFTSSKWLPDGALSCLKIPPGGLGLPMHSAVGWMGSLCHHQPACETDHICWESWGRALSVDISREPMGRGKGWQCFLNCPGVP